MTVALPCLAAYGYFGSYQAIVPGRKGNGWLATGVQDRLWGK